MRALRILLRHRVTSWLRNPSYGAGTVAGQIVILALLLFLLAPLGIGSYVLGDVLRELYPEANALALINGGMLYLVPVLMAGRFLLQAPPSERVASYTTLPVSPRGLLNGQLLLSLLSVHTVFAVVLVGPVWAAEVAMAWSPTAAGAWLATALLLAVVIPSHGANLLHLLLGRRPWGFAGVLALGAGLFAADATLGPDLFRTASQFLFGRPVAGALCAVLVTAGMHAGLLRAMRTRLEVDRRTMRRREGPSWWEDALCRWIEQTLPAGRLVALDLRQVLRTRRLRGLVLHGSAISVCMYGLGLALTDTGTIEASWLFNIGVFGIGGIAFGGGFWIFGMQAGHADGLFARPHPLRKIVRSKLTVLWVGLLPGSSLLFCVLPWLNSTHAAFLGAWALYWWGILVPGFVYLGVRSRVPLDTSASVFSTNVSMSPHRFAMLPVLLAPMVFSAVVFATESWWLGSSILGAVGMIGLIGSAWTVRPFTRQLDDNRREMLAGFRKNEPI